MGKEGICIHYTLSVVSKKSNGLRGLWSRGLSCFFPYSHFGPVIFFGGVGVVYWERGLGCLLPHFSVPPGMPYCHSARRPRTDKGPESDWLHVAVCGFVSGGCTVSLCVFVSLKRPKLCRPSRSLSPPGGRSTRSTTPPGACCSHFVFQMKFK